MKQQTLVACRQSDRQQVNQYRFLLSGFTNHEKTMLAESITRLGGKYLDSKTFVRDCSHVVSVRPMKSEKYLCGCAAGKWIVTPDFIAESLASGHWLNEEPYIWGSKEQAITTENTSSMASAPKRWINHLKLTNQRAFSGWTVVILVSNKNNRHAVYKRLIECGGGVVRLLRLPIREPDSLAKLINYVFVDKCFEDKVRPLQERGVPCLVPEFIAEFLFEQSPNQEKYDIATYVHDTKKKCSLVNSAPGNTDNATSHPLQGHPSKITATTATATAPKTTRRGKNRRMHKLPLSQSSSSSESLVFTGSSPSCQSQTSLTGSPLSLATRGRSTVTQSPLAQSTVTPGSVRPSGQTPWSKLYPRAISGDMVFKRKLKFSPSLVHETVVDVKRKHSPGHYTRVPYWMQVQPPKYQDDQKICMAFPQVVGNLIDAYLEEDFWLRAVQSAHLHLSAKKYPPPSLIHVIMSKILESTDVAFKNHAIHLLKSVLCLHRPTTHEMSLIYLQSFVPSDDGSFGLESDDPINTPWDFISSVIGKSLQRPPRDADTKESAHSAALRHSAELLLGYIVALLEQDFQAYTYREENSDNKKRRAHHCMLSTILWPSHRINASGAIVRQLITFMLQAVIVVEETPNMYLCLKMIMTLVQIAAECCRMVTGDSSILGDLENGVHQDLATEIASMATQIGLTDKTESLNILLSLLHPDWLKLKVTESLLSAYDDSLVLDEHRPMASESLSLKKVVNYYFYLIPPTAKSTLSNRIPNTTEELKTNLKKRSCQDTIPAVPLKTLATRNNISKQQRFSSRFSKRGTKNESKVNRRNIRGETPLLVACIKNDVAKVRELLACPAIQVNLTDYVGWTALHEAANHGHVDCVKELLKYRPRHKITAYFTSDSTKKCQDALDLVAAPAECGTTPLHDAVYNGHVEVARLLVQSGGKAVLMARNMAGDTALDLAVDDAVIHALELSSKNSNTSTQNENKNNKENFFTSSESRKRSQTHPGSPSKRLCVDRQNASPTEERYTYVMGTTQNPKTFVSEVKCEQFCLLVCHLLQACLRTHKLVAIKAGLDDHQASCTMHADDAVSPAPYTTTPSSIQYTLLPPSNPCGVQSEDSQIPFDAGSCLMDDLTEMSQLESHVTGFVHHLGRIGPWVGSQRSNVCNKVIYEMKVLVETCI